MELENKTKNIKSDYESKGWVGPISVFTEEEILYYRNCLLDADTQYNLMSSEYRCKSQVLFTWLDEMSRHPNIISIVEKILGPNFHCWDALMWFKKAGDGKKVSYHQDATYWNFTPKHRALTVWIPFHDVNIEQGPIRYVKDTHQLSQIQHSDIKSNDNLLMRGQTANFEVDKTEAVCCSAGSVILHSPFVLHGSDPNRSSQNRYACGFLFVSTECKPILEHRRESTIMISGQDDFGYMDHDPRPGPDFELNLKNWRRAYDNQHINYFALSQIEE